MYKLLPLKESLGAKSAFDATESLFDKKGTLGPGRGVIERGSSRNEFAPLAEYGVSRTGGLSSAAPSRKGACSAWGVGTVMA